MMTPHDQMSTLEPYRIPRRISGAMKAGVPHRVFKPSSTRRLATDACICSIIVQIDAISIECEWIKFREEVNFGEVDL